MHNFFCDIQIIGSINHKFYVHPVAQLIHERINNLSSNTNNTSTTHNNIHNNEYEIALAVEGGCMRGCISAGMIRAIHYLNLTNVIDVIYLARLLVQLLHHT